MAGRELHWVDHGEGVPVLLLHGNPTWSFLWRRVIQALPPGIRAIAPDLFGFGLSEKPRDVTAHSLEAHVATVISLVETLRLDRMVIVGQDWGGPIGAAVAARLGPRVRGAVFANTTVLEPRRPIRTAAFHRLARVPVVSTALFRGAFPIGQMDRAQGERASIGPEARRAYRLPFPTWGSRAGPLALARMVPSHEEHPSLPAIREGDRWARGFTGPLELVWGLRDPVLGRALKRLKETLPVARITETQAGHFLQEEVPSELAAAITRVALP